jgi:hypothetical protein
MRLSYIRKDYTATNRTRVSCLSKIRTREGYIIENYTTKNYRRAKNYISKSRTRESFTNKGYIKRTSYLS